jgi:hypothetical protein
VALQPVQVLPRLGLAPGFAFVDQRGERLTSDDLRGGITLYGIGYGGCGSECEKVESRLRGLYGRLDETGSDPIPVRLVSVSLDPDGDDLAEWARAAVTDVPVGGAADSAAAPTEDGADSLLRAVLAAGELPTWSFATADTAHLRDVVGEGFETWHARQPDGSIEFEPALVIVDQLGVKRAVFRYQMPDVDGLVLLVREMAKEARATGAAHLAYEAAHLFACYTPY